MIESDLRFIQQHSGVWRGKRKTRVGESGQEATAAPDEGGNGCTPVT